jgi:hypothetical protein
MGKKSFKWGVLCSVIMAAADFLFIYHINYGCKTNTLPTLMHQMRISTNQVSSMILKPKNIENPK